MLCAVITHTGAPAYPTNSFVPCIYYYRASYKTEFFGYLVGNDGVFAALSVIPGVVFGGVLSSFPAKVTKICPNLIPHRA